MEFARNRKALGSPVRGGISGFLTAWRWNGNAEREESMIKCRSGYLSAENGFSSDRADKSYAGCFRL
jgi:hypothetical protein